MGIGERIKQRREELGLTVEELASRLGKHRATVYRYESNEIEKLPTTILEPLAIALDTTPAFLMGWEEEKNNDIDIFKFSNIMPIEKKKFPLLGNIACGEPIFADEEHDLYIEAGANIQADFCLRAKGNSMIGARIFDGDIVFIRKQPEVENGQIAAVIIDDEATLKRVSYFPEKSMLILKPENPKYEDLVYIGEELNSIRILGKAVAFQSDIK